MKYVLDGKTVPQKYALEKYNVVVYGTNLPKKDTVFTFSSEKKFLAWSKHTKYARNIKEIEQKIRRFRRLEGKDDRYLKNRQKLVVKRIESDMKQLARKTKLRLNSKAIVTKAMDKNSINIPIFDPAVFYDWYNYSGHSLPLPRGYFPKLSWFGWNDRIVSARIWGFSVLFQHSWFRGQRCYLIGIPYQGFAGLGRFNFVQRTSSVIVVR